jgi:hypothetical protein
MARSHHRDPSITQSNNASHVTPKRGMPRRAKRHSNKVDRQILQRDTAKRIDELRPEGA